MLRQRGRLHLARSGPASPASLVLLVPVEEGLVLGPRSAGSQDVQRTDKVTGGGHHVTGAVDWGVQQVPAGTWLHVGVKKNLGIRSGKPSRRQVEILLQVLKGVLGGVEGQRG